MEENRGETIKKVVYLQINEGEPVEVTVIEQDEEFIIVLQEGTVCMADSSGNSMSLFTKVEAYNS